MSEPVKPLGEVEPKHYGGDILFTGTNGAAAWLSSINGRGNALGGCVGLGLVNEHDDGVWLSRDQARSLASHLLAWADTGKLEIPVTPS